MHHFNHQKGSNHILSRIDPRVKLLSALAMLVMVISGKGLIFPLGVAVIGVSLCLFMGIRPKAIAFRFAEPGFIIVMVVLLKLFCTGHTPLFSFNILGFEMVGHSEGLAEGLLIASRIAGAVVIVTALSFSTPFTELMAAFAWLRVPGEFIEIALFAWRYLFMLFDDARVIYSAQKNRLGYLNYRQGLRSFGTLTGSLVVKAFDNSRNIATAMQQRGYDGSMPMLKHKPFKAVEVSASIAVLVCLAMLWNI
jgi:cobalt/nickel transport system permease protein